METLSHLFRQWAGVPAVETLSIGATSASSRRYFRLRSADGRSAIGTVAADIRENQAFFAYTRHLHSKGMPVPELYAVAPDRIHYLQQDLGDQSLYGILYEKKRQGGGFDSQMLALYQNALVDLAAIQQAGRDMDFSVAYPRPDFDRRSIMWDLNYFKYNYLKLAEIPFDEELLENDFCTLTDLLLTADTTYFLYRDFNPRNIMVIENSKLKVGNSADATPKNPNNSQFSILNSQLYYIDYQGGRRGARQYDVASLLYSAKSDLPDAIRNQLLNHYLKAAQIDDAPRWTAVYYAYVLLRILQTLGAYGYRGLYQGKDYFRQSIPLAVTNLNHLMQDHPLPVPLPHLRNLELGVRSLEFGVKDTTMHTATPNAKLLTPDSPTLTVSVSSFSYKQGLPADPSGNGGGHIFDCRALPNPGRYPEYKAYTGKDLPVIRFLQKEEAVATFLAHAKAIVAQSVDKYIERRFTSLTVAFGCTGGQHRSVYCAEQIASWLRSAYPSVNVVLHHREQAT